MTTNDDKLLSSECDSSAHLLCLQPMRHVMVSFETINLLSLQIITMILIRASQGKHDTLVSEVGGCCSSAIMFSLPVDSSSQSLQDFWFPAALFFLYLTGIDKSSIFMRLTDFEGFSRGFGHNMPKACYTFQIYLQDAEILLCHCFCCMARNYHLPQQINIITYQNTDSLFLAISNHVNNFDLKLDASYSDLV